MDIDISNSQVSILIEIDNKIHLVGMEKEELEIINVLIKKAVKVVVPTNKTQEQLNSFLNYKK